MEERGYIRIYTGNGQGKTTAAFGLAVRALEAGRSVFIGQFVKSMKYNETGLTNHYPALTIKQYGCSCFINRAPSSEDAEAAARGWEECRRFLKEGTFDMVVLDELNIALFYGLLSCQEILDGLRERDSRVEVVITGRYAPQKLIDAADLVTEMREVTHYYSRGVLSRFGFDR